MAHPVCFGCVAVKEQEWFFWRVVLFHSADSLADALAPEFPMPDDSELDLLLAAGASETEPIDVVSVEEHTTALLPPRESQPDELDALVADAATPSQQHSAPRDLSAAPPLPEDARPALTISGFEPNCSSLRSAHADPLFRLARQIVASAGNRRSVRGIRIVGLRNQDSPSALSEKRAEAVRAALAQGIARLWPGLESRLNFSLDSRGANTLHPGRAKPTGARRAVQIFLDYAPAQTPLVSPVIFSKSPGHFAWQTETATSPESVPDHAPSPGDALRALSSRGFFYVLSTEASPARWICSLEISLLPSADQLPQSEQAPTLHATGLLISPRHVLTAAHCLFSRFRDSLAGAGAVEDLAVSDAALESTALEDAIFRAASIRVALGRNGEFQPFGFSTASKPRQFRCSAHWRVSHAANPEFDFGLITLDRPLQKPSDFWGRPPFRMSALPDDALAGAVLHSAGYPERLGPSDESLSPFLRPMTQQAAQWSTVGTVTAVAPRVLSHDLPFLPGQDGSPLWAQQGNERFLVGILTTAGQALRVTPRMLTRLKRWMAEDGVRPAF
jgi:Trypsin-like peptidase domain